MELQNSVLSLIVICVLLVGPGQATELVPEFHQTGDARTFFLHKDSAYEYAYFIEMNAIMEAALLSFRDFIYTYWYLFMNAGVGKQNEQVIFDPQDARYALIPTIEVRLKPANFALGLDHFCAHVIDRKGTSLYWNKGFITAFSKNWRDDKYRAKLQDQHSWDLMSRLAWRGGLGYYIVNGFGSIDDIVVSKGHPFQYELKMNGRYAIYRKSDWFSYTPFTFKITTSQDSDVYVSLKTGITANLCRPGGIFTLFLDYNLVDNHPIWAKDGLVEMGIRFYK